MLRVPSYPAADRCYSSFWLGDVEITAHSLSGGGNDLQGSGLPAQANKCFL